MRRRGVTWFAAQVVLRAWPYQKVVPTFDRDNAHGGTGNAKGGPNPEENFQLVSSGLLFFARQILISSTHSSPSHLDSASSSPLISLISGGEPYRPHIPLTDFA